MCSGEHSTFLTDLFFLARFTVVCQNELTQIDAVGRAGDLQPATGVFLIIRQSLGCVRHAPLMLAHVNSLAANICAERTGTA